ncbi:MAG: hypothetical protein F6K40_17095 [Okeania sp. SIO3I5]|uniref:hypothetical protein n=1 Tax=Okeania sp. SIO3I5 TaxID=2607805 RepID=UPI0013B925E9|nr:hypothetical protein [Okeania sp. SIO3I5]NEQ37882.1 hypothetical protein [Okeania sp. SIO3I5]
MLNQTKTPIVETLKNLTTRFLVNSSRTEIIARILVATSRNVEKIIWSKFRRDFQNKINQSS